MMCRFCGVIVLPGAAFCAQCGAPQPQFSNRDQVRDPAFRPEDERGHRLNYPFAGQRFLESPAPPERWVYARRSIVAWDAFGRPLLPVRSFRKQAIFACLLYFPFFLPGLIASAVWWSEANTIERRTGIAPAGKGCLTALLLFGLVALVLWLLAFGLL